MGARKYTGEIKGYSFTAFSDQTAQSETYSFKTLEVVDIVDSRSIAKEHGIARSEGFNINQEVMQRRGHAKYEVDQHNIKIAQEVQKNVDLIKSDIIQKAYEEGLGRAKEEIEAQFKQNFEQQVTDLTNFVDFIKKQQQEILDRSKKDLLKIIHQLTHWILQRELNIDYVSNLLPLILGKIQEGQKILVKVDSTTYQTLKDADHVLQTKFSSFKDLRVIVDDHITYPGVIVETDSNIFNATQEAQKQLIDSLFSNLLESSSGSNTSES